ncbi:MAG: hypothetical protein JXX28_18675 [Deltaproteobacteria bacterium]|nr:hypothetical protein [Deltaproteobacteria bacterium]
MLWLTLLLACGEVSEDPVRARFETEFPAAYCGWLEDRKYDDTVAELMIPRRCEGYYQHLMALEREHHECFSPQRAEDCLNTLNDLWWDCDTGWWEYAQDDAYVCTTNPRPLPLDCGLVTWAAPCNYNGTVP